MICVALFFSIIINFSVVHCVLNWNRNTCFKCASNSSRIAVLHISFKSNAFEERARTLAHPRSFLIFLFATQMFSVFSPFFCVFFHIFFLMGKWPHEQRKYSLLLFHAWCDRARIYRWTHWHSASRNANNRIVENKNSQRCQSPGQMEKNKNLPNPNCRWSSRAKYPEWAVSIKQIKTE